MFSDISGGFFMLKTIHLLTIKLPYPSAINYGRYTVDIRLIHGRYTVYSYRKSILSLCVFAEYSCIPALCLDHGATPPCNSCTLSSHSCGRIFVHYPQIKFG